MHHLFDWMIWSLRKHILNSLDGWRVRGWVEVVKYFDYIIQFGNCRLWTYTKWTRRCIKVWEPAEWLQSIERWRLNDFFYLIQIIERKHQAQIGGWFSEAAAICVLCNRFRFVFAPVIDIHSLGSSAAKDFLDILNVMSINMYDNIR